MEMDARGIRIQFVVATILPLTANYFSHKVYNHFLTGLKRSHFLKSYFVLVRIQNRKLSVFLKVFFQKG